MSVQSCQFSPSNTKHCTLTYHTYKHQTKNNILWFSSVARLQDHPYCPCSTPVCVQSSHTEWSYVCAKLPACSLKTKHHIRTISELSYWMVICLCKAASFLLQTPNTAHVQLSELHLGNVGSCPLGYVKGDVLLRWGPRCGPPTLQLSSSCQNLHIQPTYTALLLICQLLRGQLLAMKLWLETNAVGTAMAQ